MGTRHLTVIVKDNQIKLAQYGQWDGYFEGQGIDFVEFVRNKLANNIEGFSERVDLLKNYEEPFYNELVGHYNEINKNKEFFIPFHVMFPQFSRDTGVKILDVIYDLSIFEFDGKCFPIYIEEDSDWIEYIYAINLDTEEIYMLTSHDFNKNHEKSSCLLIETTYQNFKCWYKSTIKDIHSVQSLTDYANALEL